MSSFLKEKRKKAFSILLSIAVALLFFVQCGPPPAPMEIIFYYPTGQLGENIKGELQMLQLNFSGPFLKGPEGSDTEGTAFDVQTDTQKPVLTIKCNRTEDSEPLKMEVEVLGYVDTRMNVLRYSGRQLVFHKCGQRLSLPVFISPVDKFSTLTSFGMADDGETVITQDSQMNSARAGMASVYLPTNRIFITGGAKISSQWKLSNILLSTELFDPIYGYFDRFEPMSLPRAFHTANVVGDKVVIIGGIGPFGAPNANKFQTYREVEILTIDRENLIQDGTAKIREGRAFHSAVPIDDTRIFIFGGITWSPNGEPEMAKYWEVFDIQQGKVVASGELLPSYQRVLHSAVLLDTGEVLIVGGLQITKGRDGKFEARASSKYLKISINGDKLSITSYSLKTPRAGAQVVPVYPPGNGAPLQKLFAVIGGMKPREKFDSPFQFLAPREVLSSVELISGNGTPVGKVFNMKSPRVYHTATRLEDGRILIFGGLSSPTKLAGNAEYFFVSPKFKNLLAPQSHTVPQRRNRFLHSAVMMPNGYVVIFGGLVLSTRNNLTFIPLRRGELFNPDPNLRPAP